MLKGVATPSKGRCLFSTNQISAGELIAEVEPILLSGTVYGRCEWCGQAGGSRCALCGLAHYCGRAHQKAAWKYHKRECKYFVPVKATAARDPNNQLSSQLRLAMQMLDLIVEETYKESKGDAVVDWDKLMDEWLTIDRSFTKGIFTGDVDGLPYATVLEQIRNMTTNKRRNPEVHRLLAIPSGMLNATNPSKHAAAVAHLADNGTFVALLLSKIENNSFAVETMKVLQYAAALFPQVWLINHSCLATAFRASGTGGRLQVRAMVDISPDAEITVQYLPTGLPTARRKAALLMSHGFDCSCLFCQRTEIGSIRDELMVGKRDASVPEDKLSSFPESMKTLLPDFINCLGLPSHSFCREVEFHRLAALATPKWPGLSLYSSDYVRTRIAFCQNILDAILKEHFSTKVARLPPVASFDADGNIRCTADASTMNKTYQTLLSACALMDPVTNPKQANVFWQFLLCHRVWTEAAHADVMVPNCKYAAEDCHLLTYALHLTRLIYLYYTEGMGAYVGSEEVNSSEALVNIHDLSFTRWLCAAENTKMKLVDSHVAASAQIHTIIQHIV